MKIKSDFITNSSTASYIMSVTVDLTFVEFENEHKMISFTDLRDYSMKEIMTLIEKTISMLKDDVEWYNKSILNDGLIIDFNSSVTELCCDGWGGDYNFAGNGRVFLGDEDVARNVMTKTDVELKCKNGKIIWPELWRYQGQIDPRNAIKRFGIDKASKIFEFDNIDEFKRWVENN